MAYENGVTESIIDELQSADTQGDQMECETDVTPRFIDEFVLGIFKEMKWKVKMVLLEVSLMNFILRISKEIKMKVKVVLLEVSLINFILRIYKEIK